MRKIIEAAAFLLVLAAVGMQSIYIANCEIVVDGNPNLTVNITSPESRAYSETFARVNFTIEGAVEKIYDGTRALFDPFFRWGCELDYNTTKLAELVASPGTWFEDLPRNSAGAVISKTEGGYEGYTSPSGLSEGVHNVTVWVRVEKYLISYSTYLGAVINTVSFKVDTHSPIVSNLTVVYAGNDPTEVSVRYSVDETTPWQAYSLDGKENVTINGNTTLTGLSEGSHNITVYANDAAGNMGKSETVFFTVTSPAPSPTTTLEPTQEPTLQPTLTPTPTSNGTQAVDWVPTVLAVVVVVAVAVAALTYFWRRKP